jgi:GNAT superfamily N-acetyltransferase
VAVRRRDDVTLDRGGWISVVGSGSAGTSPGGPALSPCPSEPPMEPVAAGLARFVAEDVFVDESGRGRGVGRALVRHVTDEARRRGCHELIATSRVERTSVHELYRPLGLRDWAARFASTWTRRPRPDPARNGREAWTSA